MSMREIGLRGKSIFFMRWMGGAAPERPIPRLPEFPDTLRVGERWPCALIDIQLSKNISGLPTMGGPKIGFAEGGPLC